MKTKIITVVLLFACVFSACITEIEFDQKTIDPKLVINSINIIDSVFTVEVTSSKPIPGLDTILIKGVPDAKVTLFVDGTETERLMVRSAQGTSDVFPVFVSKTKVEPDKEYTIQVSHPNYKTVSSTMRTPKRITVVGFDTVSVEVKEYDYVQRKVKVTLRFTDDADEANFYRINVSTMLGVRYSQYLYDKYGNPLDSMISYVQVMNRSDSYIDSDDPVFEQQQDVYDDILGIGAGNQYNLFTDDIINGKTYELSFYIDGYTYQQIERIDTSRQEFFRMYIELYGLSQEAYWYIQSVGASGGDLEMIMSEPIQVYSNISQGIGIFTGCSRYRKSFEKGDYPIDGVDYRQGWSYSYSPYE